MMIYHCVISSSFTQCNAVCGRQCTNSYLSTPTNLVLTMEAIVIRKHQNVQFQNGPSEIEWRATVVAVVCVSSLPVFSASGPTKRARFKS